MNDSLRFIDCEPLKEEIARLTAELAASQERERALLEAAAPLVHFINRWEATPLRGLSDEFYSIHSGLPDKEATLRIGDFRALRAALGEP